MEHNRPQDTPLLKAGDFKAIGAYQVTGMLDAVFNMRVEQHKSKWCKPIAVGTVFILLDKHKTKIVVGQCGVYNPHLLIDLTIHKSKFANIECTNPCIHSIAFTSLCMCMHSKTLLKYVYASSFQPPMCTIVPP